MLKAIVFDFDGVLVDSEPLHYQAFVMVGKGLGFEFDYDDYLLRFIGFDDRDAFRLILAEVGYNGDAERRIAELMRQKQQAFTALVKAGAPLIPGALPLARQAADAKIPVAIASGATTADIDLMLDAIDGRDPFEVIVSADMVEQSKPDPRTYALAYERLAAAHPDMKLKPGLCLAIEDTAAGIASARGAGMMTLGLTTTGPAENLRDADRVVDSLEGVTVATLRQWYND
jgi:beta-phosphoglucomutase